MLCKNTFRLKNKNIIVTGASGGLGRELTLRLIRHYGCRVLGIARSGDKLEAIGKELGELSERFEYLVMDISQKESWNALSGYIRSHAFEADALINNAGMLPAFAKFGSYSGDVTERCISLDFNSVVWASEVFVPLFCQKNGTAIINISSSDALCPLAGTSVYSACKAAVKALSEAMREEYRGKIYIPAVCPGFIRTDIMKGQSREVSPLVRFFSMPSDKAARILLRRINAKRSRIVLGFDAHFMSAAYRIAPVWSIRFFKLVFKASGLEMFKEIF